MRDDVITGKVNDNIVRRWIRPTTEASQDSKQQDTEKCIQCYGSNVLKPLSMTSFDIITEWYVETPLLCQILFEKFINKESLRKTENKTDFLTSKLSRLYVLYDGLLNVFNKNYCGILQDRNTQELAMHYQSINSVFNITYNSGATQSLNIAENKLKKKAHSEKTYHNTFLKKQTITYSFAEGIKTEELCIRDCILIFMMDNLVRLKKHNDPDPGESRSIQLCTLPITLKGIPKDAQDVDQWHESSCEAVSNDQDCQCKHDVILKKESVSIVTSGDIDSVVLHLFALAHLWPRLLHLHSLKFRNDVYVILQKSGETYDIYNMTAILSLLEQAWKDEFVGQKLSKALSLGGNDYLPKFYGISHQATVELVFNNENFFKKLFKITFSENSELNIAFSTEHYIEFVKYRYTPKRLNPDNFTYNEIRQLSIKPPTQTVPRNPQLWMPPASAIRLLSKNVQCLIAYYLTAGRHSAAAPNFLLDGCLMKMKNGDVEYDLGAEAHTDNIDTRTQTNQEILQDKLSKARLKPTKRKPENTPQKGRRRKMKPMTSTPRKSEV